MKRIIFGIACLTLIMATSCTKNFEKTNENPNAPEKVSPDLLLPYGIKLVVNYYWGANDESLGMMVGDQFPQHWAGIQYADVDRYLVPQNIITQAWKAFFVDGLQNFNDVEKLGIEMNHPNYTAIAMIMKSWTFSLITDIWGDIPYTDALQADKKTYSPKYDAQKDIYAGIIKKLEEANNMIVTDKFPVLGDILNKGDMIRWKKFANSLSLRLLNRMQGKTDAPIDVNAEVARILNNPSKYPVIENNAEIIRLNYLAAQPNTNPIYVNRISRDDFRVSKTLVDYLKENNDKRLEVYANKAEATGEYVGIPNGLPNAVSLGLNKTSKVGSYFTAATAPAILISYSELLFIKSELAHKGVTAAGNAQKNYEDAIAASYGQYDLNLNADFLAKVAYEGGTKGYEQILTQKWVALFGQGIEAWTEQRRTEIPSLKAPEASVNNGKIPTRLAYPLSEEALNYDNYSAALANQKGENNMQMKLWWAK